MQRKNGNGEVIQIYHIGWEIRPVNCSAFSDDRVVVVVDVFVRADTEGLICSRVPHTHLSEQSV